MKPFPLIVLLAAVLTSCRQEATVYDLRCEGLAEPLGIDTGVPHFSWKIRSSWDEQAGYELQTAASKEDLEKGDLGWTSRPVMSRQQIRIPYGGAPLPSRSALWWRVRVFGPEGEASAWSAPQRMGTGILEGDTLKGQYIGAVPGEGRSPLLRKRFTLSEMPERAVLHVNSLGYHEVSLNGEKVSDAVLTPAVSQLDKRSLTVTYDLLQHLAPGENELILAAGSGWYKSTTFGTVYDGPLVKAELDLDGEPFLWTDDSWEGAWSGYEDLGSWTPHRFVGERIDARVKPVWGPVDVVSVEGIRASAQMCEPCRIQEVHLPVSVERTGDSTWRADLGRVMNAMLDVTLPCLPAGHKVVASCSDFQRPDGSLDIGGRNEYIASGAPEGDRFVNRFNHQVVRYIEFSGLPEPPTEIRALRMRTDYPLSGRFTSSDQDLNRIYNLVAWTMENLAFDGYMVDCAGIERLGYGGDGNASTLSLQALADVAPLYLNWLQAWADATREDGGLPHTAPNPYTAGGGPYWCSFLVQAAWRTFQAYADPRPLERFYPQMQRWLQYVDRYTVDGLLQRWPDLPYRGWYLGDWAAPRGVDVQDPESIDLVNNCALCQVYLDLEQIAAFLGEDAAPYRERYQALTRTIHARFYHPETGYYASGSQLDQAFPLLVGVVPEALKPAVTAKLKERTASVYGGHLATGLVGIPVITEWATLAGECDWLYSLLKAPGYPGYLNMLDQGATGVWEEWDGGRSRLHNCYNGILSWFFQALGGIRADVPGAAHLLIDPQIPAGLDEVQVAQNTPYGLVRVHRKGSTLEVELPVGTSARIAGKEYPAGKHRVKIR